MSTHIAIADAVVAELQTETWSQSITAVRTYVPKIVAAQLVTDSIEARVVAGEAVGAITTRAGEGEHTYKVYVGLYKKLEDPAALELGTDLSEGDAMMDLMEEIADDFAGFSVEGDGFVAPCLEVETVPFQIVLAQRQKLWGGSMTLTFGVVR